MVPAPERAFLCLFSRAARGSASARGQECSRGEAQCVLHVRAERRHAGQQGDPASFRLTESRAASSGVTVGVYGIGNALRQEGGITFNTAPKTTTSLLSKPTISGTTPVIYSWNVTAYVQAQRAKGARSVSLCLRAPAVSPSGGPSVSLMFARGRREPARAGHCALTGSLLNFPARWEH